MPGTTFHHEHILESPFPSSISLVSKNEGRSIFAAGQIQMVVVVTQWQFSLNPTHIQITWITSRIYRAPPSRAFTSGEKTELYPTLGNKLSL